MRPINRIDSTVHTTTMTAAAVASPIPQPRSPWHSPVPYLFGGLAAMLGLIAFALLILACSYWRLSGRLENNENGEGDIESGNGKEGSEGKTGEKSVFEERILVIMAGNQKPTFLATPVCNKASSCFSGTSEGFVCNKEGVKETESSEKVKEEQEQEQEQEQEVNAERHEVLESQSGQDQQVQRS